MKQIFIFVLLFFCLTLAQAQVKFGIRLGGNVARYSNFYFPYDLSYGEEGPKYSVLVTPVFSLQAGVVADIPLSDKVSFQPGILYSQKGTKFEYLNIDDVSSNENIYYYEDKNTIKANYLDIPLTFIYKTDLGAAKLLLGAGPYLAYGFSGSYTNDFRYTSYNKTTKIENTSNVNTNSGSSSDDLVFGSDNASDIKKTDFGVNLNLGIELRERFQIGINYGLGLSNLFPYDEITSSHNRVLSLTATYLFGN